MVNRSLSHAAIALIVLVTLLSSGCTNEPTITWEDSGRGVSSAELENIASDAGIPEFHGASVDQAKELRTSALVSLRAKGDAASELADLLTKNIPPDSRSVPYYFESANFDGRRAWIVVELWGSAGGSLDNGRMWVFDQDTGDIIVTTTFKPR